MTDYIVHLLISVAIYSIVGVSFNLLMGFAGIVSIAQAAFFGIGAYAGAAVAVATGGSVIPSLLAGGLVSAATSVLLSAPTLRLRGHYMAIASLGFQFAVYGVFYNWTAVTGGPMGFGSIPTPRLFGWHVDSLYDYLILTGVCAALATAVLWWLARAPFGRLLKAIRDDELAARSLGKNVVLVKTVVFAISAGFAGVAGCLYAQYITYIHPDNFMLFESVFILAIVIVGGLANVWGAVCGAVVLVALPEALRFVDVPYLMLGPLRQMIYGALLVLFVLLRPEGLIPEHGLRARRVGLARTRHRATPVAGTGESR
ncbi:MAG: branched-chain amino acid ABC transporter permease [Parvibaculum sp.]